MRDKMIKTLLSLVLVALSCHVKMFGCFPFVAVVFAGCYHQEEMRRVLVPFTYLFMVLWLPIAGLCRYGVILLVWMVVLAIGDRLHFAVSRLGRDVMLGIVLVFVSYGGRVLSVSQRFEFPTVVVPLLEGAFVSGAAFFVGQGLDLIFLIMKGKQQKEEVQTLPRQAHLYSEAMSGLAKSVGALVQPTAWRTEEQIPVMKEELIRRICGDCDRCHVCFSPEGTMTLTVDTLFDRAKNGEPVEKELEEQIQRQCRRAELLIREALGIFERAELNRSWYRRLCEHREIIAGQIDAMAYVMGDCMEQEILWDEARRWHQTQIRFRLREMGLRCRELHFYKRKNGSYRITMELAAGGRACVTEKELLQQLEHCMGEPLMARAENRSIVGRDRATYVFFTRPELECSYGVAKRMQDHEKVSGDSFGTKRLEDGRFVMVLSDGMGSGKTAHEESETIVDLFLQFAEAGFTAEMTLRLMNAAMLFGEEKERYSTLDACIVDEYTGITDFYKVGAHVSFVRHKKRTDVIRSESLPMGAAVSLDAVPDRSYLEPGDYLVLVTDGVLEYLQVEDAVEMLRCLIQELADTDAATFAQKIIERILLFTGGNVADDMTVLVLKALER